MNFWLQRRALALAMCLREEFIERWHERDAKGFRPGVEAVLSEALSNMEFLDSLASCFGGRAPREFCSDRDASIKVIDRVIALLSAKLSQAGEITPVCANS